MTQEYDTIKARLERCELSLSNIHSLLKRIESMVAELRSREWEQ